MTKKPTPDISRAIDRLDNANAADAVAPIVEAIASAIPLVGGPLAVMVGEWREHSAISRVVEVLREVDRELGALRGSIDRRAGAEFWRALDWGVESASQAKHEAKRTYYARAVARTATFDRPETAERAVLLETLDRLQLPHILLLATVASDPMPPKSPSEYLKAGTSSHAFLLKAMPDVSPELLDRLWEDLATLRLVDSVRLLVADQTSVISAHVPDEGLVHPFGRRFLEFIGSDDTLVADPE